jgi:hypothetical protein
MKKYAAAVYDVLDGVDALLFIKAEDRESVDDIAHMQNSNYEVTSAEVVPEDNSAEWLS